MRRVLVIKLGALGDVVQALAPMKTIRDAHPEARITVLTTPPFADFFRASGLADEIETDGRPTGPAAHLRLFRRLRAARYDRVYDLQTSGRTKRYWWAFLPNPPEWSGISAGTLKQTRPDRDRIHNLDRMADQLHVAGVGPALPLGEAPVPDLSWAVQAARGDSPSVAARFGLQPPFTLLIPGASPVKPEKLWPVERYAALAAALIERGYAVAVLGGPSETPLAARIRQTAPSTADLTGRTSFIELAGLGAEAALYVGNDTGPAHVVAYAGAPGVMLLSRASDPVHVGPRGPTTVLKAEKLSEIDWPQVLETLLARASAA